MSQVVEWSLVIVLMVLCAGVVWGIVEVARMGIGLRVKSRRVRALGYALPWKHSITSNGLEAWTAPDPDGDGFVIVLDDNGRFHFRLAGWLPRPGSFVGAKTLAEAINKAGKILLSREEDTARARCWDAHNEIALRSAERFNAGVRGPFHILPETDPEPPSPPPPLEQERRRRNV